MIFTLENEQMRTQCLRFKNITQKSTVKVNVSVGHLYNNKATLIKYTHKPFTQAEKYRKGMSGTEKKENTIFGIDEGMIQRENLE